MESFAYTGDQLGDDNVKPVPPMTTTEPPEPATSELNCETQYSDQPVLADPYPETTDNALVDDNNAVLQAPTSTAEVPSADTAQLPPSTRDSPAAVDTSADIDQKPAVGEPTSEHADTSNTAQGVDPVTAASWEAAQDSVLKEPATEDMDGTATLQSNRGRCRGRPRASNMPNGDRTATIGHGTGLEIDQSLTTPVRRGRGGRPRGRGSGRSKGKAARKRRGDNADGDASDSDELSDDSGQQAKDPIVTKSGRSITKPSQYNPVAEPSPSGGTKRKRSHQPKLAADQPKFADQIWCVKCLRGHSPPSNQIVLCDGCDAAYHQWCHDPIIGKEVAEDIRQSWFCGNCLHEKETQHIPIEQRVPGANLTHEERTEYLSLLPKPTLVALLTHSASLHPELPLFARNARQILQFLPKSRVPRPTSNQPLHTPPSSQAINPKQHQQHQAGPNIPVNAQSTTQAQQMHVQSPINQQHSFPHDPYPEYSNEAGDPPATYPRPGRGPIKLQATTHPEDHPWMFQDNYEAFSHLVNDGTGRLVAMQQRPEGWPGMPGQNGNPQQAHQPSHPPPHHQHPNYRQHAYNAAPPPPHGHPAMQYAPHMAPPPPHQHQQQHPSQQFHSADLQQQQQWNPQAAYSMPPSEHMQQRSPQQQQPPSHPGAMAYGGGSGGGGGDGSPTQ